VNDLRRRLAVAEKAMQAVRPEITCIVVSGGLSGSTADDGAFVSGSLRYRRENGEEVADFRRRVVAAAQAAGVRVIVFGGLPIRPRGE
jgi:hypothetical protein